MFVKLLLVFTVIPLIELALLIQIGKHVGVLATVGLVLITGAVGAALARQEGFHTLTKIQDAMAQGRVPADELIDGLMILVAGAFLLTPGLLTDLAGFSLLIPPARKVLKAWAKEYAAKRFQPEGVYDAVYRRQDPDS